MSTTQSTVPNSLRLALDERRQNNCFRHLRQIVPVSAVEVEYEGSRLLNFSSNDYLGLSKHTYLKERAIQFTERYGVGGGASRLVCGNSDLYDNLEERLAGLKKTEASLVFSTGYQLNFSVLQALGRVAGAIYCDRRSHNSLLLGAQASGARFSRFAHNDMNDLQEKLKLNRTNANETWVVTESVFGMDGDLAPLEDLVSLSRKENFQIYIDEAHATGVFGENGMGLADSNYPLALKMGTFSKGCGSFGAYIACSREMKDYLVNFCPGLIYSTALPPAVLGAIDAALTLIPAMTEERNYLLSTAELVRKELKSLGIEIGNSQSQIIPVIVGEETKAESLSAHLLEEGIFALPIRPPTVPAATARVRFSLSAMHTEEHIDKLLTAMRTWREKQR
jgi:8-amino-7-oxononanoate synthase